MLQFAHKNKKGKFLTNTFEGLLAETIQQELLFRIKQAKYTDFSDTFLPYFDSVLGPDDKSNLVDIKTSQLVGEKIKSTNYKNLLIRDANAVTS